MLRIKSIWGKKLTETDKKKSIVLNISKRNGEIMKKRTKVFLEKVTVTGQKKTGDI